MKGSRRGSVAERSMPAERVLKFLLDEHYPGWLAEDLTGAGIDTVSLTAHRPALRGADDGRVLEAATAEGRVVVTEDVSTFAAASTLVPHHVGVVPRAALQTLRVGSSGADRLSTAPATAGDALIFASSARSRTARCDSVSSPVRSTSPITETMRGPTISSRR